METRDHIALPLAEFHVPCAFVNLGGSRDNKIKAVCQLLENDNGARKKGCSCRLPPSRHSRPRSPTKCRPATPRVACSRYRAAVPLARSISRILSCRAIVASLRAKASTSRGLERAPHDCVSGPLFPVVKVLGERMYSSIVEYCFQTCIV